MPTLSDLIIQPTVYTRERNRQKLRNSLPDELGNHRESVLNAVNTAMAALQQVGRLMERVEQTRQANLDDPNQNAISARVNTWRYAKEKLSEIDNTLRTATGTINTIISNIKKAIGPPPAAGSGVEDVANEIRAHTNSLSKSDRQTFIYTLLENEDYPSLSAILSAPAYLSGLSEQEKQQLEADYSKARYAQELRIIEALQGILNALMETQEDAQTKLGRINSPAVQNAIQAATNAKNSMDDMAIRFYK